MINCDLCEQSIHETSAQIRNQYFLCLNCDDNSDKDLAWELYLKRNISLFSFNLLRDTLQCDVCCKDIPIDDFKINTHHQSLCIKCYNNHTFEMMSFFLKHEGIETLSQIQDDDGYCESYFSSSGCECCNRQSSTYYDCVAIHFESKKVLYYSICVDCIYHYETGEFYEDH